MKKDGSYIWVESTLRSMKRGNGNIEEWIAASRDITEQKDIEGKLKDMSYIDGLTEIHNRRYFDETIVKEWGKAIINSEPISLLILDIDYFKN
jgi:PleD family two-component response regulator